MRITNRFKNDNIVWKSIFTFILIMQVAKICLACGSYQKIGGGGSLYVGTETAYAAYINCIWWLETDAGYQLSVNFTWVGDENYGRCGDFIVIRDGKDDSSIILDRSQNCTSLTNHVVTASSSWMRIQFRSDGINYTTGFQGIVHSTYVGSSITNYSDPIRSCRSYEWECSNKECATISYRCDGFNDCGCYDGCDEHNCEGMDISKMVRLAIGCSVGVTVFLCFFFFALAYEHHLRMRTLMADPEAQAEHQRKKAEKKRREAYQKAAKEKKAARR